MSEPGNQNAYKNKPWADALRRAMIRYEGGKENALNLIADQTVKLAVSGEPWAIKEVIDRVDGKAVQATEISGVDGDAVELKLIEFVIKRPE